MDNQNIPLEYQITCPVCGKILDMRDINTLSHGGIEEGKGVCYDEDIPYSGSQKIGEPIFWDKNKKPTFLN